MRRATALFCSCERSFWHCTTMLVGRCVMRTAELVLFTCCPPAPLVSDDADVEINDDDLRIDTYRSSGEAWTETKLVCRRLAESNGLIRTRRWTPRSAWSSPYTFSPSTVLSLIHI